MHSKCSFSALRMIFRCGLGGRVQFWCSSGAVLMQFWCSSVAVLVQFWCSAGAVLRSRGAVLVQSGTQVHKYSCTNTKTLS